MFIIKEHRRPLDQLRNKKKTLRWSLRRIGHWVIFLGIIFKILQNDWEFYLLAACIYECSGLCNVLLMCYSSSFVYIKPYPEWNWNDIQTKDLWEADYGTKRHVLSTTF